ncbi:MAG: hypothetical protein HUJ51_01030 [Eggerthellaceae bacterium]|nr:hypothetical protein [Eggerthellaceae bacterium]
MLTTPVDCLNTCHRGFDEYDFTREMCDTAFNSEKGTPNSDDITMVAIAYNTVGF